MKNSFKAALAAFTLVFALSSSAFATTWFPKEFTCPIDGQKNTFNVVGSYGSYIYSWPSKYQWLFWPRTDSNTFYLCKKCHLATYMWDFDEIPKDKIPALKAILADVKVSKQFDKYNEIPVLERLAIMEKVYTVLDTDDDWWNEFYRMQGYHYHEKGDEDKAAAARRKALALTEKQLKDEKGTTPKKLLYYISGAMKHFLKDDNGALADFQTGLSTKYVSKGESDEEQKNAETGLNERLNDYIKQIKSDKKPRDSEQ